MATTANTRPRLASSTGARASPVSLRPGTVISSTPITAAAVRVDVWEHSPAITAHPPAGVPARSMQAEDRAATRADRLPMVPPDTKHPPALGGRPARLASQRQGLVLGPHRPRPLQPGAGVDGAGAHHHVGDDRHLGRRGRDVGQVAGEVGRQAGRLEDLGEDAQDLGRAQSLLGDARPDPLVEPARGDGMAEHDPVGVEAHPALGEGQGPLAEHVVGRCRSRAFRGTTR